MSALDDLADLCGILPSFYDLQGNERLTTPETQKAFLTANGIDVSSDAAVRRSLAALQYEISDRWFPQEIIVESGTAAPQNFGLGARWDLRSDDSDSLIAEGVPADYITLPPLASGVYVLTASASGRTEVITVLAAPKRLPDIKELTGARKLWGLNAALYGLQSNRNSGLGDFADLADIAQIAGQHGAGFLGVNPLHNMGYCDLEAISPYSPSHRGFLNTAYIALDRIPGLEAEPDLAPFQTVRTADTVQYVGHKQTHNQMLGKMFERFSAAAHPKTLAAFEQFKSDGGSDLEDFGRFEALSEIYGTDWQIWPEALQSAPQHCITFHIWLQWVATCQLAAAQKSAKDAGMPMGLYLDLAVGSRRDGAESWCDQSALAQGVSIGAPPDHLSPAGQNWNLAAFAPRKLKAQRYRPLRRILAQTLRYAGIIRIDHVLGLNRSFWVPDDGSPGAYIRQPFESLLAIIKIEAERHSCAIVGEDLGLVPDGFRDTMRGHGFYGYSVMQYEKDHDGGFRGPADVPSQVLSCFATHDTPTVKGYEVGRDIDWWHKLDWINADAATAMHAQRRAEIDAMLDVKAFETTIPNLLAQSNADLVAVQLDDVLSEAEAQNLPGTIDQHPNWRRKYDVSLETLANDPRLKATAAIMIDNGRAHLSKGQTHED
jgi:4-alpha-glucanotransferase